MHEKISGSELVELLTPFKYDISTENDLQNGVERVLVSKQINFEREYVLTAADRPDFFVVGRIALELKIKGSVAQVLRQISRYAKSASVSEIVVIGTPAWIGSLPSEIEGKPLHKLRLMYSFF